MGSSSPGRSAHAPTNAAIMRSNEPLRAAVASRDSWRSLGLPVFLALKGCRRPEACGSPNVLVLGHHPASKGDATFRVTELIISLFIVLHTHRHFHAPGGADIVFCDVCGCQSHTCQTAACKRHPFTARGRFGNKPLFTGRRPRKSPPRQLLT